MRRSKFDRRLAGAVILLTLATPGWLAATTIVAKSFAELCREADRIFVGTVAEVASQWKDRGRMQIETLVRFTGVTPVDGTGWRRRDAAFRRRRDGGHPRGDRRHAAASSPTSGVVVFARDGTSISPIVGFRQGLFRVVEG